MTIAREELDRQGVDFADVASGRRLPPVHPGRILRDEFLEPMDLSVYLLARDIKAPRTRLNEIVLGRRAVTVDTALRLARYFGTTAEFWINLQTRYDLDVAELKVRPRIDREVAPRAACSENSCAPTCTVRPKRMARQREMSRVAPETDLGRSEGLLADGCRHQNLDPVLATARFAHLARE